MEFQRPTEPKVKISVEHITEKIRALRNAGITRLMDEHVLMAFMDEHFNTVAISAVKTEFLKRDLKELSLTPLDLAYYSSLITQVRNSGDETPISDHPLFMAELLSVFQKYGFTKS